LRPGRAPRRLAASASPPSRGPARPPRPQHLSAHGPRQVSHVVPSVGAVGGYGGPSRGPPSWSMAEVAAEFVAVVGEHAYAVRGGRRRRHREERVSATGKVTGDPGDLLREDVAVDVER